MNDIEYETLLRAKFLEEGAKLLEKSAPSLTAFRARAADGADLEQLYRLAHNFKSGARTVGFQELGDFAASFEALARQLRSGETELTPAVENVLRRCHESLAKALGALALDPRASFRPLVTAEEIEACLRDKN